MLLNCEGAVKDLISAIAKNEDIKGTDIKGEAFASLPNSITGVVMHFICEGIKSEFDIAFEEPPVSLKGSVNAVDKKVAGKKRLLTRDQKNELLDKNQYELLRNCHCIKGDDYGAGNVCNQRCIREKTEL